MNDASTHAGFARCVDGRALVLYQPTFPNEVFEEIRLMLEDALQYTDEYTADDLLDSCRKGTSHLWVLYQEDGAPSMAMVTGFCDYPRIRYLHVLALGGSELGTAWKQFWPHLRAFMLFNNCSKLTAAVRPQLMRILTQRYGFGHMYSLVSNSVVENASEIRH